MMIETWVEDLLALAKPRLPDGASTGMIGLWLGDLFALVALVINIIGSSWPSERLDLGGYPARYGSS